MVLNFFRKRGKSQTRKGSILDLPVSEYDPATGLPRIVTIGDKKVPPLLTVQEVQNHLIFLQALYEFRFSSPDTYAARTRLVAPQYAHWAQNICSQRRQVNRIEMDELPSLGILMCWHAHMLNPKTYSVDVEGAYKGLKGLEFPLELVSWALTNGSLPVEQDMLFDIAELNTTKWTIEDIAQGVERQSKFVVNMHNIRWLDKSHWDQVGTMELQIGIVLYHAWLDLAYSTSLQCFLVPRLDIDLAWHSHQLHGARYKDDTVQLLGQFLGHDDTVGDGKLESGLKQTGELWKAKFGYDYQPPNA
ncbi:uncharacterized protein L203_106090 [Cryptococcus depauperatus CBS 7841]|uniref:Uncharacterized protein n=1 Tax=Cryptococcus depauperatus CBS 7841 TaxID=1295531 RepID=A0A1E3IV86_9TREE|nr:hypothetical protein L203_00797 [Cryptococcus depauperatus CBS 7841]